jgi:regulatory protein
VAMIKKEISPEKALQKAESYCAYQERSQQEVRYKIYSWGLHQKEVENILSHLITNGFLKEERFASAYTSGKLRIKKWGRIKIRLALQAKRVSEPLIKRALSSIDEREYEKILREVIHSRERTEKEKNPLKRKSKIASYVISRGFEPELIWRILGDVED